MWEFYLFQRSMKSMMKITSFSPSEMVISMVPFSDKAISICQTNLIVIPVEKYDIHGNVYEI